MTIPNPHETLDTTGWFCTERWVKDGVEHLCYKDYMHQGDHVCGLCDAGLCHDTMDPLPEEVHDDEDSLDTPS